MLSILPELPRIVRVIFKSSILMPASGLPIVETERAKTTRLSAHRITLSPTACADIVGRARRSARSDVHS